MIRLTVFIIFFILLIFLRKALIPLWIGITFGYVLDPMVSFWERKFNFKRLPAVAVTYLSLVAVIALLTWGFADIVTGELASGSLQNSIKILKEYYFQYKDVAFGFLNISLTKNSLTGMVQDAGGAAVNVFLGAVIGFYLLKDKEYFLSLLNKTAHLFLKQRIHGNVREILADVNCVIASFIRGVFVDSVIITFLSAILFTVLDVEYGLFLAFFTGITNVIPYFGPIIGIVPAFISAFTSGGFSAGLIVAGGLFAIQQVESNFIYPKIVGNSVGLHPLMVLLSVTVAGYFGGLLWMILAVPIAGIVNVLITAWAYKQ